MCYCYDRTSEIGINLKGKYIKKHYLSLFSYLLKKIKNKVAITL